MSSVVDAAACPRACCTATLGVNDYAMLAGSMLLDVEGQLVEHPVDRELVSVTRPFTRI